MSKTKSRSSSKKPSKPVKQAAKPSKGAKEVKKQNKPIVKPKTQGKSKAVVPVKKAVKKEETPKKSVKSTKSSGKVSKSQPKGVGKTNRPIKKAKIEVKSEPVQKKSAKKPQVKAAETAPKVVPRESNIDYLKYFASKISEYERKNKNIDSRQGQAYNLYEDLKIFTSLKTSQNLNKDVNQIKVKVLRSSEGIRDRYSNFLTYISASDYQSIYDHIQKNGLQGFLTFDREGQGKTLRSVSLAQPKETTKKSESIQKQTGSAPQQQQFNNFFNINATGGFQGLQQTMATMMQQMFNPTADKQNLANVNIDIISKKDKKDLSREEEQLSVMAQAFALKNSKEPKEILQLLHQCSGNIETLEQYFDQNQQHLAWDEEEDRVLRSVANTESQQFKNLQKAKGLDSIKQRISYLGLRLNV